MSLYERILDRGKSPWVDDCGFQRVPLELYQEMFKNLNVRDLRTSMEVCFPWAMAISQFGCLREKSTITTWNIDRMSRMDTVNLIRRLAVGEIVILDSGFRLNGILMDNFFFVMLFGMKNNAFEHVTHLEITNSHVRFLMLRMFGITFKNVESLVLKDVYIEVVTDEWIDMLNIKTIKISVKDKWERVLPGQREAIPTPQFAQLFLTPQLEEYALEYFDSALFRRPIIEAEPDERSLLFTASPIYALQTLQENATTLKSFSLKTFDSNDDHVNALNQNDQEQPMDGHDIEWNYYLGVIDVLFPNLNFSEMKLEKLTLTFRLIQIALPVSQRVLLHLLRSQTSLKEFTLSQVYFPEDGAGVMHDLLTSLPRNCRTNLEGVMTLRRNPENPDPNPDDAGLEPPIQGYMDSTVELITQTVNLTLRFVSCQSLDDIDFFTRNLRYLKKIKIQQPGAHPVNKIVLTDPDIQRIITDAPQLKVLWLEFCNLSAVTDFGLTGISAEACARMTLTKDFEIQDGDLVGSPISSIKNLRSLNLSEVGDHVTDVTAHHGFKGLGGSLTSFGISSPKMTSAGMELLKRLFQYNGVVKFDGRRKFDHCSLPGEEIAAPVNTL